MVGNADEPLDQLMSAVATLTGQPSTQGQRRSFERYLQLLLRWNRTYRMTALRSPAAIVRQLFLDSLLFLLVLPPRPLIVADLGAGAGIPGVPLRLVDPGISMTLIEAKRKRVSFLLSLRRDLGLDDLVILEGRAEDLIRQRQELAGKFDVTVTRAVGSFGMLAPLVMNYLKPAGLFLASGPPSNRPVQLPSGVILERAEVDLPFLKTTRLFLKAAKGD